MNIPARIVNVVASTRTNRPLDLDLLSTRLFPNSYEPEIFCGLIYRRQKPRATLALFGTGKITSTGTRSESAARESLQTTLVEVNLHMHEEMTLNAITTENIVATGDVGHRIDLEKLVRMHGGIYEPSQFPGAILRIRNHTTFLVFTNGKLVCVGSKKEDDARSALVDMQRILVTIGCLNSTMD